MAYAEELAERIRDVVFEREGVTEKKMFPCASVDTPWMASDAVPP